MRSPTIAVLLSAALLFHPARAPCAQDRNAVASGPQQRADAVVLRRSAAVLAVPARRLRVERPYAAQPGGGGDALDIFEIVMAVEEDLGIAIHDDAIYRAAGVDDVDSLAQGLSIAELQAVVREALSAKAD